MLLSCMADERGRIRYALRERLYVAEQKSGGFDRMPQNCRDDLVHDDLPHGQHRAGG